MDILILHIMKYFIAIFTFALYAHCCAQFIPQPMGYNPDENSDGLIGAGDLQGLLALYGNTFDNGDSTAIEYMTFSVEDQALGGSGYTLSADGCCLRSISESTDIVYLHKTNYCGSMFIELPIDDTFKTLLILCSSDTTCTTNFQFYENGTERAVCNPLPNHPEYFILVRGHNGLWYRPEVSQ